MAMYPEIKTRWTGKLREEGRKQTRNMLRDASGAQCCLDVLCEVAVDDTVIEAPVLNAKEGYYEYAEMDLYGEPFRESNTLPKAVREWAGLDSSDPEIADSQGVGRPASAWNDYQGKTFLEIADLIDADETL